MNQYLNRLPKIEQEIFTHYYDNKISQKDLAKIYGLTQGAISVKIKRAKERLSFITTLEKYDIKKILSDLRMILEPESFEIVVGMIKTTNQSETARRVNCILNLEDREKLNQVKVRHRFNKVLDSLRHEKGYEKHFQALSLIKNNLYILSEVLLPQHDKKHV